MINEKMANELSVKVGDTVSVTVDDKTAELTVGGIYEQYKKIMCLFLLNFTVKNSEKNRSLIWHRLY